MLSTGESITLQPDVYKYEFSCKLPEELPTSLEGTYGNIRYTTAVTINVPIWPDKIFEKGFTVIKAVNLNEMFELKVCVRPSPCEAAPDRNVMPNQFA